ncbi:transglycosylase SLT domain-containing protein [Thauera phenolivorans]|uniref:transglycosylase SLT domain-containing protein n=1 Tax=Thauera phenolivorans TaxID=1792543 RepID=UPI0009F50F10|nr:transglycosylase SLT domain-containing protein [Thauera phenolivorans]
MAHPLLTALLILLAVLAPAAARAQLEAGADAPLAAPARVLTLDLTRDANDIWDRIRRGYGMADLDSPQVAEQQAFYLNHPGYLKQVFARGGRYLYYIVDELERRGMPTELALLPMVESNYNPLAYSAAHASGLWQFIPSTGKYFNLTQDRWVDERRDVIASTNAALDYLQRIYEMHGDWHLALASYNWGEGSVKRAIERNRAQGLPAEYSRLRMPEETRKYVPKLQAIKNIVAQPELFAFELPYVANELHFVTVEAPTAVDLGTAARLAGLPLEEFIALNPGFNRPAAAAGRTFVVPADRAQRFEDGLAELEKSGQGWQTHTLQAGETLEAVAARYGLSSPDLRQLNALAANSNPGPGYSLLVPDGIDPSHALEASRLLPFATSAGSRQGLRAGGGTGVRASGARRAKN